MFRKVLILYLGQKYVHESPHTLPRAGKMFRNVLILYLGRERWSGKSSYLLNADDPTGVYLLNWWSAPVVHIFLYDLVLTGVGMKMIRFRIFAKIYVRITKWDKLLRYIVCQKM